MGRAKNRPSARSRKGRQTQQEEETQAQAATPSQQETQAASSQRETLQSQEESQAQPAQEDIQVEQTPNKETAGYGLRGNYSSVPHNDGDRRSDDGDNDKNDVGNEDDSEEQREEFMFQTEYEKQREQRIRENQAKLAALQLPSLTSSFHNPELAKNASKTQRLSRMKQSTSEKVDEDDDDYRPSDSSGESDMDASEEETYPNNTQEDACGEDEDLQQALALSLEDHPSDKVVSEDGMQKPSRAKRRPVGSSEKSRTRLKKGKRAQFQLSNDEIVSVFSLIDEQGRGRFSVTELERVAHLHDFTWTKQELFDMIDVFDCNKDGQLNFTEFQGIFGCVNEC